MIDFLPLIVLSLAVYRVTRFFVFDSLVAHTRQRVFVHLANSAATGNRFKRFLAHKALEGFSCTWCMSIWFTFAAYWLYTWTSPEYWGRLDYISALAVAGAAGLLHAFEPNDEE